MNKKAVFALAITAIVVERVTIIRAHMHYSKKINELTKENRAYQIVNEELVKVLDDPDTITRPGAAQEFETNCAFRAMTIDW